MSQPPAGTQAIGRALAVLQRLTEAGGEASASALASDLGLTSGTTNRVLRALAADGYVVQNPRTDAWLLGGGAVLLGQAAQRVFGLDQALPVLETVNQVTDESVNLSVRDGGETVVMLRVQSVQPLRFEQHPGARFPAHTTASGKAILAFSPDRDAFVAGLPDRLPVVTDHSLRTREAFVRQLDEVRRHGHSWDDEENVAGVRCVGAPVLDQAGIAQAAVVIQVPTVRMPPERGAELVDLAVTAARDVARLIPMDRRLSR